VSLRNVHLLTVSVCVLLTVACSQTQQSTPLLPGTDNLLVRAFTYGLDSLADKGKRRCVAFFAGREYSDPPSTVLNALREGKKDLLSYSQCRGLFGAIDTVHDTVMVWANLDSLRATQPTVALHTWRSGTWGAAYRCPVRDSLGTWILSTCDVEYIT
jgi:hypothetical protein